MATKTILIDLDGTVSDWKAELSLASKGSEDALRFVYNEVSFEKIDEFYELIRALDCTEVKISELIMSGKNEDLDLSCLQPILKLPHTSNLTTQLKNLQSCT